jgi:aminoglycoside 3-N-acetyltransferase
MTEKDTIDRSDDPVTVDRLVDDLRELGIEAGETLIVHSSLSSLGWVCGGAPAVVDALREAVTAEGTLVVPTHTGYSDPAGWGNPPVPDDWEPTIRETMPAFDPAVTPTRGMGAIPECFRTYPDVRRSRHPVVSFAAWGAEAGTVVEDHSYDEPLGENSPLARVYDLDGRVLLLGVGHDRNTSLHLAEYRGEYPKRRTVDGGPVLRDGERRWLEYVDIETRTDDFSAVGEAFELHHPEAVTRGTVGYGTARLYEQRALVDFATAWFGENRPASLD